MGPLREGKVVGDHDQGGLGVPVQLLEHFDDSGTGLLIQIPRGLIGKENARPVHERARKSHPLLFSTGELGRVVIQTPREPYAFEQFRSAGTGFPARPPQFHWDEDVLERRKRREKMERLEDEADPFGPEFCPAVLGEREEINTVQVDTAARRVVQPGQQTEQGRLPTAGRPDDRDERLRLDLQVDRRQHL